MKLLIYRLSVILISCLLLPSLSSGQKIQTVKTNLLNNRQHIDREDLFITSKYDSTTQVLNMNAINCTDTSILLSTYRNGYSAFNLMIKNTAGDWQAVDLHIEEYIFWDFPTIGHEPDSVKMRLPSNSYISGVFPFKGKANNFNTEIRFSIRSNGKTILSDPIPITVDSIFGLTKQEKKVLSINEYLLHEKGEEKRQHAQLIKVDILMKLPNREREAYDLFSTVLLKDSKFSRVSYMKGKLLFISAVKGDKVITHLERYLLYNAVIKELSKIKSKQNFSDKGRYYRKAKKVVDEYESYELSQSDWDVINNLKCDQSTEAHYCYIVKILKEKVVPALAIQNLKDRKKAAARKKKMQSSAGVTNYIYLGPKLSEIPDIPDCTDETDANKKMECFDKIFIRHIYKHLEYPTLAKENKIEGTVVIQISFDTKKQIYCAKILRDLGAQTGKAALKATHLAIEDLLKGYNRCKWKPSKSRGNPVTMTWNTPVKFRL